jgi:hypothetical protein
MNPYLIVAALLALGVGLAHSYLGERFVLRPLLMPGYRPKLLERSVFLRRTVRFAWHATSIAWWGFAALFLALAGAPAEDVRTTVLSVSAATFLATAVITAGTSRGRHLAWPVFLAIAAALWAARV